MRKLGGDNPGVGILGLALVVIGRVGDGVGVNGRRLGLGGASGLERVVGRSCIWERGRRGNREGDDGGVMILIAASGERLGSWMGLLEAGINFVSSPWVKL